MDAKVEENMGAIVGIKIKNVDTTTNEKNNKNMDAKRSKTWMQKGM